MPAPLSIAAAAFGLGAATALATVVNVGLLARGEASDGAGQLSARRIVTLIERSAEENQLATPTVRTTPGGATATSPDVRPSASATAAGAAPLTAETPPSLPLPGAVQAEPAAPPVDAAEPSETPSASPSTAPSGSPAPSPSTTPSPSGSPSQTPEARPSPPGPDDRGVARRETPARRDSRDDLRDRQDDLRAAVPLPR